MDSGTLRSLDVHCARLAYLCNGLGLITTVFDAATARGGEKVSWFDVEAWLRVASSVTRVEIDTARFDEGAGWCSSADEYYRRESDILSGWSRELTKFSLIWGALESGVKLLDPPRVGKRDSVVDAACGFLKNHYDPKPPLRYYDDFVAEFRKAARETRTFGVSTGDFTLQKIPNHVGRSGVGLHLIRAVRNRLAHGTLDLPEHVQLSNKEVPEVALVGLCSRLALLSMQMLILAALQGENPKVPWLDSQVYDPGDLNWADAQDEETDREPERTDVEVEILLPTLHFRSTPISSLQTRLPI